MSNTLWFVIPCYNEQEVLPETYRRLSRILKDLAAKGKISEKSRLAFVNDGSEDETWQLIKGFCEQDKQAAGINLTRNKGHQNALLAGLMTAKEYADAALSLDADLQDDVGVIEQFVDEWHKGNDIVYGVRNSRKTDTVFKRKSAHAFYGLMKFLGADIVPDHADYRLMSRRALEGLSQFREVNLFLRGIVPMIGYRTATVSYERNRRFAGESKYPLKKMIHFAIDGITSCSTKPIRMITTLGFLLFAGSVVMLLYFLVLYAFGRTVAGWTTIVVSVWGIGGIQLLALGIIGEYIGKIYMEVKERPRYLIEEVLYTETEEV